MIARGDVRRCLRLEDGELGFYFDGDVRKQLGDVFGHVCSGEQVAQVRVTAFAVEMHDLGASDIEAGLANDVRLHRGVVEVRRLALVVDLTSVSVQPAPVFSRMSTATKTRSASKHAS